MDYGWKAGVKRLKNKKVILITILALNLCFLECKNKTSDTYYISLEEIADTVEIVQVLGTTDPNITIYLTNEEDSVPISILSSKIRTIRKSKRNKELYTSFSSLDSVIDVLAKRNFARIPVDEKPPTLFFVDTSNDKDLIKIIPARQLFTTGEENIDRFH